MIIVSIVWEVWIAQGIYRLIATLEVDSKNTFCASQTNIRVQLEMVLVSKFTENFTDRTTSRGVREVCSSTESEDSC